MWTTFGKGTADSGETAGHHGNRDTGAHAAADTGTRDTAAVGDADGATEETLRVIDVPRRHLAAVPPTIATPVAATRAAESVVSRPGAAEDPARNNALTRMLNVARPHVAVTDACLVALDGDRIHVHAATPAARCLRFATPGEEMRRAVAGEAVWLGDPAAVAAWSVRCPGAHPRWTAVFFVPLPAHAGDQLVMFFSEGPIRWTDADRTLLQALAPMLAGALSVRSELDHPAPPAGDPATPAVHASGGRLGETASGGRLGETASGGTLGETASGGRLGETALDGPRVAVAPLSPTPPAVREANAIDQLTGLLQRTPFHELLVDRTDLYHRTGEPLALLIIDIDGLSRINDTHGLVAGDILLRTLGQRLVRVVGDRADVARLEGDAFGVLLDLDDANEAEEVAEKILRSLSEPVASRIGEMQVRASIGIATTPRDEAEPEHLLRSAELALVDAKFAGGGRWTTFHPNMRRTVDNERALEADLELAIANDELVVHYQPVFETDSRSLRNLNAVGFEALVRWEHPTRGLVAPGAFIPVAEQSDLICDIGAWVLRRALHDLADWLTAAPGRRVCVNVAVRQLLRDDFVDMVLDALSTTGLQPQMLELELSEEIVAHSVEEHCIARLTTLTAYGVGLAFDDFGTGYSSMLQLRKFPGQTLKIDRQYVERLCEDAADRAIARGMIDLGRSLGLRVVAEGVETREQLQVLSHLGCQEGQGFLLGRPLPIDAALDGLG